MLSKEGIGILKNDGVSFEQINEINKRVTAIDNGTATMYSNTNAKEKIFSYINSKMKLKCIK